MTPALAQVIREYRQDNVVVHAIDDNKANLRFTHRLCVDSENKYFLEDLI